MNTLNAINFLNNNNINADEVSPVWGAVVCALNNLSRRNGKTTVRTARNQQGERVFYIGRLLIVEDSNYGWEAFGAHRHSGWQHLLTESELNSPEYMVYLIEE